MSTLISEASLVLICSKRVTINLKVFVIDNYHLNLMSFVATTEHFLFNCDKYVCTDVFKRVHAENHHKFQACIDSFIVTVTNISR